MKTGWELSRIRERLWRSVVEEMNSIWGIVGSKKGLEEKVRKLRSIRGTLWETECFQRERWTEVHQLKIIDWVIKLDQVLGSGRGQEGGWIYLANWTESRE